jgi:hypothetical protein
MTPFSIIKAEPWQILPLGDKEVDTRLNLPKQHVVNFWKLHRFLRKFLTDIAEKNYFLDIKLSNFVGLKYLSFP